MLLGTTIWEHLGVSRCEKCWTKTYFNLGGWILQIHWRIRCSSNGKSASEIWNNLDTENSKSTEKSDLQTSRLVLSEEKDHDVRHQERMVT